VGTLSPRGIAGLEVERLRFSISLITCDSLFSIFSSYLPGILLEAGTMPPSRVDLHNYKHPIFKRIILFAVGRPGVVDGENVNCAENEQICRYSNG
jgi:hypothetical protein